MKEVPYGNEPEPSKRPESREPRFGQRLPSDSDRKQTEARLSGQRARDSSSPPSGSGCMMFVLLLLTVTGVSAANIALFLMGRI